MLLWQCVRWHGLQGELNEKQHASIALPRISINPVKVHEGDLKLYQLSQHEILRIFEQTKVVEDTSSWKALFERWSALDPEAAMQALEALETDHPGRWHALGGLFANQASIDIGRLLKLAGEDGSLAGLEEYLEALVQRDPAAAIEIAHRAEKGFYQMAAIYRMTVYRRWAQLEPNSALRWVLDNEENTSACLYAVADGWSDVAPQAMAAAFREGELWRHYPDCYGMALSRLVADNPGQAFQLFRETASQLLGFERQQFIAQFQKDFWMLDQDALLQHLEDIDNPALLTDLTKSIIDAEALPFALKRQLVERLPAGEDQARTIAHFTETWFQDEVRRGLESTETVQKWLANLPNGVARDHALLTWAQNIAATDPAAALESAAAIEDEIDREAALMLLAEGWLRRLPEQATEFIAEFASFDDSTRAWLLSPARWE